MDRFLRAIALVLLVAWTVQAQDTPKVEVFGGYSYFRLNPDSAPISGFNLNGWNASLTANRNRWLGFTADFSGHYGKPEQFGLKLESKAHSFLFGPRIHFRQNEKVTPFVQALFGATRFNGRAVGLSNNTTGFATALGGGVDVKAGERVAIRVLQIDYQLTRLRGQDFACFLGALLPPCPIPATETQHNLRLSAGVVFRFGKK